MIRRALLWLALLSQALAPIAAEAQQTVNRPVVQRQVGLRAGTAVAILRTVPISAYEAYVIAPHATLGAVALHLIYGNGTNPVDQTPADSLGAPFGGWRIQGFRTLPSVASNPVTEYSEIIYSGVGSQEYAINVNNVYGGTYHGGLNSYVQTGPDMTQAAMLPAMQLDHTATISWTGGEVAQLTGGLEFLSQGVTRTTHRMVAPHNTLTVALALFQLSPAYTRASTDLGATWADVSAGGYYDTSAVNEVWWRNPTTGTIAKVLLDRAGATNFEESNFDVSVSRVKYRARFDTPSSGNFGDQTVRATYSFAASEPDPIPSWSPFTDSFNASNPSQAGSPLGWTRVSAPAPNSVVSGGNWTVTGLSGSLQRFVRDAPLPPGTYHLDVDYSTGGAYSAGGVKIAITSDGSGTGAIVATSSFNSASPTTKTIDFVVPTGQSGYITFEASTTLARSWTASELRVTGAPD
ncbi:hypothetical protein [Sphingobium sp. Z007]|uniref:hypothetical protein n=1 Tax=Sphingobium sp. Z007 TaxID=627495 RepID=UPI000B49F27A|nr:hypothetical protein [Sphingobium sp. Z007]